MSDLVDKLMEKMAGKAMTLVTAESCTGGLISSAITSRPGASRIFDRGFVTYSNDAKRELLDVPEKLLKDNGAVSTLVAEAMVKGALKNTKADIAIAVTGIAGPEGGSESKPVGLVYIGYGKRGDLPKVARHDFTGNREQIRLAAVKEALKHALDLV